MSFYKISYEIHYSSAKPHHVPCVDESDYDPVKNRWHFTWGCGYRHPRDAGLELDEAMDAKRDILSAHDNISLRESVICTEIFEEDENAYEVVGISVILTEYRAGETRNHRFRAKNVTQMDSIQEAVHRWHCSGELNKLCAILFEINVLETIVMMLANMLIFMTMFARAMMLMAMAALAAEAVLPILTKLFEK